MDELERAFADLTRSLERINDPRQRAATAAFLARAVDALATWAGPVPVPPSGGAVTTATTTCPHCGNGLTITLT